MEYLVTNFKIIFQCFATFHQVLLLSCVYHASLPMGKIPEAKLGKLIGKPLNYVLHFQETDKLLRQVFYTGCVFNIKIIFNK